MAPDARGSTAPQPAASAPTASGISTSAAHTGRGGGAAGPVIAVVLLPAAVTGCADQKSDHGPVLEVGIVGVAHIHCRPATPPEDEKQETVDTPEQAL